MKIYCERNLTRKVSQPVCIKILMFPFSYYGWPVSIPILVYDTEMLEAEILTAKG